MNELAGLPREKNGETDRKFVEALARGLDILRAFQPGDGFLGNQEISARTGLPKSSISRLTYTLTKLGYLTYSDRLEKYQLGSGVLALGYAFVSNLSIRQVAKPLIKELATLTGTSVGLVSRDRLDMIYIEGFAPTDVTSFRQEIGNKFPIFSTAAGRAYLAALPEREREYFMSHLDKKIEGDTKNIRDNIEQAVECYKQNGFCYSWGEWNKDTNAIAVPLVLSQDQIYVFNAGGPEYRLNKEFMSREVAPQLKNMVRNIEATLIRY